MIEAEALTKRFGSVQAVDSVSLSVKPGEIYGLLGPNGAGKTTLIKLLTGLERPDGGAVSVAGRDVRLQYHAVRRCVGLVPQELGLYAALSARENLRFWGTLYGLRGAALTARVNELLTLCDLVSRADDPLAKYSGGMKRRLNLAAGLIHEPKIAFLDEPTLEVDPQSRRRIMDFVRSLAEKGMTLVYTTHQLGDAEEICDRIGIIDSGRLVAEGTLEQLRQLLPFGSVLLVEHQGQLDDALLHALRTLPGVGAVQPSPGVLQITAQDARSLLPQLMHTLTGVAVDAVRVQEANLESVFLHLTGRRLRE